MAPKLLYDVITRQAGSIEKAWLEAVMNSVDAGATKVEFCISPDQTIITDDGKGMTKEEVIKFFEVFGAPLERGEEKTYGEFRMGRGQLFAFGINKWITKTNLMSVDIKNKGLNYSLEDNGNFDGCKITIQHYKKIESLEDSIRNLEDWTKYVPIKVVINGETIEPENQFSWELNTKNSSYRLKTGNVVKVFNQGIFVKNLSGQGVSGIISTKKPLKLNFARNDIQDDCEVWKKIEKEYLDLKRQIFQKRMTYLNEEAKKAIIYLMYRKREDRERFSSKKVFRTANGNWVSLEDLKGRKVALGKYGDRLADKIMQLGGGIILDQDFVSKWRLEYLVKYDFRWDHVELGDLTKGMKNINLPVSELNLSKKERRNLEKLRYFMNRIYEGWKREIKAGKGLAEGWTDGESYICINRRILKLPFKKFSGAGFDVLFHELAHDNSSEKTDIHGENFYKRFHDLSFKYRGKISEFLYYIFMYGWNEGVSKFEKNN